MAWHERISMSLSKRENEVRSEIEAYRNRGRIAAGEPVCHGRSASKIWRPEAALGEINNMAKLRGNSNEEARPVRCRRPRVQHSEKAANIERNERKKRWRLVVAVTLSEA